MAADVRSLSSATSMKSDVMVDKDDVVLRVQTEQMC